MIRSPKTVLALSPHADDVELGCGGTIARLVESGAKVHCAVFAQTEDREQEMNKAGQSLGVSKINYHKVPIRNFFKYRHKILDRMVAYCDELKPDLVLTPSLDDTHQDHVVIAEESFRAFKRTTVWGYEVPWNNRKFDAQVFVALSSRHLVKKVTAIGAYKSQSGKRYIDPEYVKALMRTRGIQLGVEYAECFSAIREVVL